MTQNIYDVIVSENTGFDGLAVIDQTGRKTYPELFDDVNKTAVILVKTGVKAHDRCALIADDSYAYIVYSLAILKLNASIVPLSTRAVKTELQGMLDSIELSFVIAQERYCDNADGKLPYSFVWKRLKHDLPPLVFDGGPAAFIRFSSGTTGRSKGVILSHGAVLERTGACKMLEIGRGETVLWVLDMAYHFVVTILLFLRRGAVIRICPAPVEANMAAMIRETKPHLLYATPYHYAMMANSPDFRKSDLCNLHHAISTAMKLQPAVWTAFHAKFGLPLRQAYGIIEVGLPCVNVAGTTGREDSVGRLQEGYQVRIQPTDSDGKTGAIYLRGPGMFDAYLTPFAKRSDLYPGDWFATGDVGYLDPDGYLFIVGRCKDVIIFSGMKIFPYEVESVLSRHPAIREVRVYGIPDPSFGELPAADVVLRDPEHPVDDCELRSFCREYLASYKVPKEIRFVSQLPHTASGKIIRQSK